MLNYDENNRIIKLAGRTIAALVGAGIGAISGIVTNYAISYISGLSPFIAGLSPIIIGGMIGVGLLAIVSIPIKLVTDLVTFPKEFPKELAKTVVNAGITFGIGAGLVALGFTSPAAIGALAFFASFTLRNLIMPSSLMKVENTDKHQESIGVNGAATAS